MRQIEQIENLADDLLAIGARDLVSDREEVEELPDFHSVINAEVVRHEPDHPAHRHRLGGDRKTGDAPFAGRGPQERRQESDRRALARAIGPDESEDLTLADCEAQIVDRDEVTIAFGEVDHLDHETSCSVVSRRAMLFVVSHTCGIIMDWLSAGRVGAPVGRRRLAAACPRAARWALRFSSSMYRASSSGSDIARRL